MRIRVIQSKGIDVPTKVGDEVWSGLKSFSDSEESTVRKTLFIAARPDGLKNLAVFDSKFLYTRKTDQKYLFSVINTPKVLKDQDLNVHLMSSKEEKITAVDLVESFGEFVTETSPMKSSRLQFIFGLVRKYLIALFRK